MKGNKRASTSLLPGVLAGALFLLPLGCSSFENAGTVSGTVRYKGQPLSEGSICFVSDNGQSATGTIDPSGRYIVSRVPIGSAKVTVQVVHAGGPPPMSFAAAPKPAQATASGAKIPLRYGVAATSGLRHSVTKGKQEFNIELME